MSVSIIFVLCLGAPTQDNGLKAWQAAERSAIAAELHRLQAEVSALNQASQKEQADRKDQLRSLGQKLATLRANNIADRADISPEMLQNPNGTSDALETIDIEKILNVDAYSGTLERRWQQALISLRRPQKTATVFKKENGEGREQDVHRVGNIGGYAVENLETVALQKVEGGFTEGSQLGAQNGVLWLPLLSRAPAQNGFSLERALQYGGLTIWPILLLGLLAMLKTAVLSFRFKRRKKTTALLEAILKNANTLPTANHETFEHELATHISSQKNDDLRWLSVLSITAAVAPMLGLLGTVTGMIATFSVLEQHGGGSSGAGAQAMAGGISEALLTTQWGLLIAVFALLAHALLSRWSSSQWNAVIQEAQRRFAPNATTETQEKGRALRPLGTRKKA